MELGYRDPEPIAEHHRHVDLAKEAPCRNGVLLCRLAMLTPAPGLTHRPVSRRPGALPTLAGFPISETAANSRDSLPLVAPFLPPTNVRYHYVGHSTSNLLFSRRMVYRLLRRLLEPFGTVLRGSRPWGLGPLYPTTQMMAYRARRGHGAAVESAAPHPSSLGLNRRPPDPTAPGELRAAHPC